MNSKIRNIVYFYAAHLLFLVPSILAQSSPDISKKNENIDLIRKSSVKSKSVIEYRYTNDNAETLADSGYKSFYYSYDNAGRLTAYTKYHIFSDLTVKETYQYSGDNIIETMRYNSAGEMIETIEYRYKSSGKLRREIHTAYHNSMRPGIYFTILANVNENVLFSKLQEELQIEPKLESYTITVNISDPDELNQYIVIGDEMDPTSLRFSWSQLSLAAQRDLLAYTGPNRKEHTYISKNIANVNYKYDRKGNLIRKSIYNTSGDLIEKETARYNGDNDKISSYTYNDRGKISGMETYVYDNSGRLTESTGLNPAGKVTSRLAYKYDEKGNLGEKIWFNSSGEISGEFKYVYDEANILKEEIKLRGDSEKEGRTEYSYDENGNIEEMIKYNADDKIFKLIKYVYEYW
jgi:YD repeat-containing protein